MSELQENFLVTRDEHTPEGQVQLPLSSHREGWKRDQAGTEPKASSSIIWSLLILELQERFEPYPNDPSSGFSCDAHAAKATPVQQI